MTITSRTAQRDARRRALAADRRKLAQGWDGRSHGFGQPDRYARAAGRREAFSTSSAGNVPAPRDE